MPAKKRQISDEERAKRMREAAKEHETSNDPKDFERAFGKIVKVAADNLESRPGTVVT